MNISRRRFIQGAAAVPLATLPAIVFATEPPPSVTDILMAGADAGTTPEVNAKKMIVEAASEIRVYHDAGSDVHWLSNNLVEWAVEHASIEDAIFAGIATLWAYQLPIQPNLLPAFEGYHLKITDWMWGPRHEQAVKDMNVMRLECLELIEKNPKCVEAAASAYKDALRLSMTT